MVAVVPRAMNCTPYSLGDLRNALRCYDRVVALTRGEQVAYMYERYAERVRLELGRRELQAPTRPAAEPASPPGE